MYRVSQLTVIFITAMVIFATVGITVPVAASEPSKTSPPNDTVQTLENDEDLYFLFGVELNDKSVEEFIDTHAADEPEQIADQNNLADVIQYQTVDQVNLTQRGSAVSIAIDGGEATAVQKATHQNVHSQPVETTTESTLPESEKTTFENVGNIYIIFGDSYNQQFKGWGIAEKTDENDYELTKSAAATIVQKKDTNLQSATASVIQHQESNQSNYNKQGFVLALAENDSEAVAVQKSKQINQNYQEESADVVGLRAGEDTTEGHVGLSTTKIIEQSQTAAQANENQQGTAIAIAVGSNSSATAIQMTDQSNHNEQSSSAETSDLSPSSDSTDDSDTTSNVSQSQRIEQNNINLQGAAIAIAINQSNATALQYAEQRNSNNQVSSANVMNTYRGSSSEANITIANEQSLIITDNISQNILKASLAQAINRNQSSSAVIETIQRIRQENFLQQQTVVAVTKENGSAHAAQISIQENENNEFATLESRNATGAVARGLSVDSPHRTERDSGCSRIDIPDFGDG